MCCGWGKMSALDSARQMRHALLDFEANLSSGYTHRFPEQGITYHKAPHEPLAEQPDFYENSEWKFIKPNHITTDRN